MPGLSHWPSAGSTDTPNGPSRQPPAHASGLVAAYEPAYASRSFRSRRAARPLPVLVTVQWPFCAQAPAGAAGQSALSPSRASSRPGAAAGPRAALDGCGGVEVAGPVTFSFACQWGLGSRVNGTVGTSAQRGWSDPARWFRFRGPPARLGAGVPKWLRMSTYTGVHISPPGPGPSRSSHSRATFAVFAPVLRSPRCAHSTLSCATVRARSSVRLASRASRACTATHALNMQMVCIVEGMQTQLYRAPRASGGCRASRSRQRPSRAAPTAVPPPPPRTPTVPRRRTRPSTTTAVARA